MRIKRLLDVAGAFAALIILAPVMAAVAIAIRIIMGAPVLFRQVRLGRDTSLFTLVKFRTMSEADGQHRSDSERLTNLGRFLRTTSLDEIPTFWNVLRGEMSFVGPRPLLPRYLPFFSPAERIRFEVPPGITGLAQVHGRNLIPWDERLALDVKYVQEASMLSDFCILLKTLSSVVSRRGTVADPTTLMLDLDRERA